jgi:predicted permease
VKLHLALIRIIGVIVPRRLRSDWKQEWEAELRYREALLEDWARLTWSTKLDLLWRSLGALWDALWLQPQRLEDELLQDLRYGARMLVKKPAFTAVAVLSLTLGIGANAAIFSLIDTVLLKTLPVARPEQLYFINCVGPRSGGLAPPYPCYERLRDNAHSMTSIAAFCPSRMKLKIDGRIEEVNGQFVSGNYFSLLGIETAIGRPLNPSDDSIIEEGGPQGALAVIGYDYWRRRFALNPSVIGRVIQAGASSVTIVGVTPPQFHGLSPGRDVDVNVPMMLAGRDMIVRPLQWFNAVGRLESGSSVEQARSELDVTFNAFLADTSFSPADQPNDSDHIEIDPAGKGLDTLRHEYSLPLKILMLAVGLVLLISCANLANLLLARASSRRREFAVRLAMGASRLRLVRQVLAESVLLVSLGGLCGLLVARWSDSLLVNFISTGRDRLFLSLQLDGRLLLFTLGLSLLTGIGFSLAPTLRAARIDPGPELKENSAVSSNGGSRMPLGKLLILSQVSLSFILLIGAGLFLRTLQNLENLDAGFQREGVLTMNVDVWARNYQARQFASFWQETLSRVKALPGVSAASVSFLTPLDGNEDGLLIEVSGFTPEAEEDQEVAMNQVSPEYFTTFGIPLLRGRSFRDQDNGSAPRVCLLNESAARFYFGNRNPIGAKVRFGERNANPYEIVGVAKDTKHDSLRNEIPRMLYLPVFQPIDKLNRTRNLKLAARTNGSPSALITPIENEIRSIGADILMTNAMTLDDQVNQSLLPERLVAWLSNVLALVALLLTSIGLYGVMSYDVGRRIHELGIRLALGAEARDIIGMVMNETMLVVLIGAALGLGVALIVTRFISSLLFGLIPNDPLTILLAALLLIGVGAVAGYLPARRAARVDPMVALRHE